MLYLLHNHELLLLLADAVVAGAADRWLADRGTLEARLFLRH